MWKRISVLAVSSILACSVAKEDDAAQPQKTDVEHRASCVFPTGNCVQMSSHALAALEAEETSCTRDSQPVGIWTPGASCDLNVASLGCRFVSEVTTTTWYVDPNGRQEDIKTICTNSGGTIVTPDAEG
jgi:hypothetical protein